MNDDAKRAKLSSRLKAFFRGEVLTDNVVLQKYSRDQSIYEIVPLAVLFPSSLEDLQQLISFASNEGIPITPRGGGSGTAGGALGQGFVIAFKPGGFLSRISDTDPENGPDCLTVQSGVRHDAVQKAFRKQGLYLPADPSSGMMSLIGGNLATKASGPHALKYGSIDKFVEGMEFLTDRGDVVNTEDEASIPLRIKKGFEELSDQLFHDDDAKKRLESRVLLKTSSGYNLFAFLHERFFRKRLAQLLIGSVGTLGFITQATLRGERFDPRKAVLVATFHDLAEAGDAVSAIREIGVAAIEIMNRETIRVIQKKTGSAGYLSEDGHVVIVEFEGPEINEGIERVKDLFRGKRFRLVRDLLILSDHIEIEKLWKVRKGILPQISQVEPHLRALSVINDVGVPPVYLTDLIHDLEQLFEKHKIDTIIYGHAGSGNLHLRPLFDLTKPDLKKRIRSIAHDVYSLVFQYGGTITAEHGMGRLRAPYLEQEWGPALYGYMKKIKTLFDPQGIFNPDVMFTEKSITDHMQKDLINFNRQTNKTEMMGG